MTTSLTADEGAVLDRIAAIYKRAHEQFGSAGPEWVHVGDVMLAHANEALAPASIDDVDEVVPDSEPRLAIDVRARKNELRQKYGA